MIHADHKQTLLVNSIANAYHLFYCECLVFQLPVGCSTPHFDLIIHLSLVNVVYL